MKKWILPALATVMVGAIATPQFARAEDDTLAKEETAAESTKNSPEWQTALKSQYHLTDEQIKAMQDKGLSNPQMAMTAALAAKSGKSIDDILKMRTEQKMGWGKIAKELGVHPGEIGQSVAAVRHEINGSAEKKEEHAAKREEHAAKREEKAAKREERAAKREERLEKREAQREEKASHKH